MSRSGYNDDGDDQWSAICYRGAVASAIRGARGQAFLRELIAALDAMPDKALIADELEVSGSFCALGAVGRARGIDMARIDTHDESQLSETFGVAESLAREIMWINDEWAPQGEWVEQPGPVSLYRSVLEVYVPHTSRRLDELRWATVRRWAVEHLKEMP